MILYSSEAVSDIDRLRNFLEVKNTQAAVRAIRAIWTAIERVERSPYIGQRTKDPSIYQIVVRFGRHGYVVRYRSLSEDDAIFVTRIWHGREASE